MTATKSRSESLGRIPCHVVPLSAEPLTNGLSMHALAARALQKWFGSGLFERQHSERGRK
jgi:hypothetical protein